MTKKALDEKYFYQIDEHNIVHLFRGEEDCQQHLTNPLLSAIFKIETLEKENAELKERLKEHESVGDVQFWENVWSWKIKAIHLTKAKEIIEKLRALYLSPVVTKDDVKRQDEILNEAEQFLKECEK